jgi:hypothetical protein
MGLKASIPGLCTLHVKHVLGTESLYFFAVVESRVMVIAA